MPTRIQSQTAPNAGKSVDCSYFQENDFSCTRRTYVTVESSEGHLYELGDVLRSSYLSCQTGGPIRDAASCLDCRRFLSVSSTTRHKDLTIQCLWKGSDRVGDVMTLATELVFVSEHTSIIEAEEIARTRKVRHLLVENNDELVGLLCRCDLVPPHDEHEVVADRMSRHLLVIEASATIAEATRAMANEHVGCLPVVVHGLVCGVITRGDLRRLGVEEQMLGAGSCVACGSVHGVTPHPNLPSVQFCLDCIDVSFEPVDYNELGMGD